MAPIDEAKQFVGLHAKFLNLKQRYVDEVLCRIVDLDREGTGGWVFEWSSEAERWECRGHPRRAAILYLLARFPFADSPAKRRATREATRQTTQWLERTGAGERRFASAGGGAAPFLFRPGPRRDSPLAVLMGGIVSPKEQWAGFLRLVSRIGCAIAIVDFPGVGENQLRYTRASSAIYGAILDSVAGECNSGQCLAIATSFGGHLSVTWALVDPRIRGVMTVGAPLARFFTDPAARAAMPAITRSTLEFCCGVTGDALDEHLSALALTRSEMVSLCAPVSYVAALRDEIIPCAEWREAAELNGRFQIYAFDDVHGAPGHLMQTRLLTLAALCRHSGRSILARWIDRVNRFALGVAPISMRKI